jgi:hypothetical protein
MALKDTEKDLVHYASGSVIVVDKPTLHLKGTSLAVAKNTDTYGVMVADPNLTYDIEVYPDGTLSYLEKLNNIGGLPTKVQATCVGNVLLTATTGSEVVTVGVSCGKEIDIIK